MTPEQIAQAQLDAYNARDLARFLTCFSEHVVIYRPPQAQPVMQGRAELGAHYAANRFNMPGLHAELLGRMVLGNKVFDHERIHGVRPAPFEVVAVYEVLEGLIAKAYFFDA